MDRIIKILHLEDVPTDAEIVRKKLKTAAFQFELKLVKGEDDFKNALQEFSPDVILSDHALPEFNSIEALSIVRGKGLKTPFILVTGAVGEEFAAAMIKQGADDYILKDRLERLSSAIINCVERYQAEAKRREIEEGFRLTINALKDYAFLQLDKNGNIVSWNSAAENIKGFQGDQIIGKSIADFYTDTDRENGVPEFNLKMALAMGEFNPTGWRKRNDGTLYYADTVITALHDDYGNFKGYAKIIRDITERILVEEKLKESEEKYRKIVQTAQEGIWTVDENNIITFVNDKLCEMFEYQKDEIIGKPSTSFIHKEDKQIALQAIGRRKLGINENYEISFRTKSGKRLWTYVSASSLLDRNEYKGTLAMITDITARKKAEQETLSLLERLQLKNKYLNQFAYMVSHNLRAPIAKILGLASIFKSALDAEMIMQKIVEETINLDNVVRDINTIITARDTTNEITEPVVFADELKLIEQVFDQYISESNAVITSDFQQPGMPTVKGRFYSILYNLLSNALKYRSKERPLKIHVSTEEVDNFILLTVRDNGIGIDLNKHRDKMFMLYKRFHGDEIPGKGIGLNLVKVQVESLGGRIEVESEINQGSSFKVYLPKKYRSKITANMNGVFLIDDDKLCNAMHKNVVLKHMAPTKIEVYQHAGHALEDLKRIAQTQQEEFPGLIFLDLNMPEVDGWQFLDSFEQLPENYLESCKVVILTSSINQNEIEKSKTFKTVHKFISKPLTAEKVLDLIND